MGKCYMKSENGLIRLGNGLIEGGFTTDANATGLASVRNMITGSVTHFAGSEECALRVATEAPRVEITGWSFHTGSGEPVQQTDDTGFRRGWYKPEIEPEPWIGASFINQFPIGLPGYSAVVYPGYAWYRCKPEIPADWNGRPLEFVLGGGDNQDWREYWVYLNGEPIGHARPDGFWHNSPKYVIAPGDAAYALIRFGESNVLAVQARGLDRLTPGMLESDSERYSAGSFLFDQFVSAGPYMREISGLSLVGTETSDSFAKFEFTGGDFKVEVDYRLNDDKPYLYKNITVKNIGATEQTLLEIDLHRCETDTMLTDGGVGEPCIAGGDLFCVISHPCGINRGDGRSLRLSTLPGITLAPGEVYKSKAVVFGAGEAGKADEAFVKYIEANGPRSRKLLNIYNCYGIHDLASIEEPTYMTEELVSRNLDDLEKLAAKGVRFDYYYFDAGWSDPNGDLKDFDPKHWPNGASAMMERMRKLGMKIGLWTAPASGAAAFYPGIKPERYAGCGNMPRRKNNPTAAYRGTLCISSKVWHEEYLAALLHHVTENGVSGFKFDGNEFVCMNTEHGHMTGKYSVEHNMDSMIDIMDCVREACPDVMFMFYWGIRSPLWLLYGDTIYERGILMEGSTPADFPTRLLRQSITVSYDQAALHSRNKVPLSSGDSLGVWISKWRWANFIGREGWQDAWVMEIARGSLLHQLWGDLSMFDEADNEFLANISDWVRTSGFLLQKPVPVAGSPWRQEPYGYAYTDGDRGAIFLFNPTFDSRTVELNFGPEIGFLAGQLRRTYAFDRIYATGQPDRKSEMYRLEPGSTFSARMKPFETLLFEFSPAKNDAPPLIPAEVDAAEQPQVISVDLREVARESIELYDPAWMAAARMTVNGRSQYVDNERAFLEASARCDGRDLQISRRAVRGEALVEYTSDTEQPTLLVAISLHRGGIYWHHHALYEIIKIKGTADGAELNFKSTPYRWHEEAGGWSWILFEAPLGTGQARRDISFEIESILPGSVEQKIEVKFFR